MSSFPKIGDKLMTFDVNHLGTIREGKVFTINGSEIDIEFENCTKKFFIDVDSKTLFNNEGCFYYESFTNFELITRLLNTDTVNQTVSELINFVPFECRCINCLTREIEFLSLASLSIQNDICGTIAKLYIETMMIPQRFNELRSLLLDVNFDDVLQRSFEDQQSQNKCVSDINLQKIIGSQMFFDESKYDKGCSCMFCLEEFSDIGNPQMIECPNCNATFCTGDENCSDSCCKGIRYHLKNDNRCPVCRISADDWVKKIDEMPKKIKPVVKKDDFSIEDFVEKSINKKSVHQIQPDKFFPKKVSKIRYYHRGYSKRQIYGKMR